MNGLMDRAGIAPGTYLLGFKGAELVLIDVSPELRVAWVLTHFPGDHWKSWACGGPAFLHNGRVTFGACDWSGGGGPIDLRAASVGMLGGMVDWRSLDRALQPDIAPLGDDDDDDEIPF